MNLPRSHRVDLNKINESRKTNVIFNSIGSSASNININNDDLYKKIHIYIDLTNEGSSLLLNNKYNEALIIYKEALKMAEQLRDKFKKNETNCNIGSVNFYLGKLNEAINYIEPCFNYIYSICSNEIGNNNIKHLYLLCKAGANLCMCQLTMNSGNNNSINVINKVISIISKETDLYKQLFCVKYLNNTLFRVNSLLTNKNNFLNNDYINNNYSTNEDEYNAINKLFIEAFDSFVSTRKYEPWLNSLKIIYQKMEKLNDNNGMFFILFNQQLGICLKNYEKNNFLSDEDEEVNEAKMKLKSILQTLKQDNIDNIDNIDNDNDNDINNINNNQDTQVINDIYINNIIDDYNSKLTIIRGIYQILYSFEEQIIRNIQNNESNVSKFILSKYKYMNNEEPNIDSKYFIMLLLNYTRKYVNQNIQDIDLKNDLINDINNTLELINSNQIDISQIKITSFDPEIFQSLTSLLNSFFNFYKKMAWQQFFEKLKNYGNNNNIINYKSGYNINNINNSNNNNINYKSGYNINNSNNNNFNFKSGNNINNINNNNDNDNDNDNFNDNDNDNDSDNNNNNNNKDKKRQFKPIKREITTPPKTNKKENKQKLTNFFEKQYYGIYKGEILTKINYGTSGYKKHFYQIDYEQDLFESFPPNESAQKPQKVYDFDTILKIVVGIKTKNVIKKINNLNLKKKNEPYRFMSLILRNRNIDLYFPKQESSKKWYYGFYHYFDLSKRNFKIGSCTKYILFTIKCKMINQLELKISLVDDEPLSSVFKRYFKAFKEKK